MKLSKAIKICLDYHRNHSKPNTVRSYKAILTKFGLTFGDKDLEEISSEDILTFLDKITNGTKQQSRRTRYSHLAAFFNFIINPIVAKVEGAADPRRQGCSCSNLPQVLDNAGDAMPSAFQ